MTTSSGKHAPSASSAPQPSNPPHGLSNETPLLHAKSAEKNAPAEPPPPRSSEPEIEADLPRMLGRYVLLKRLARGGMGEVFLGSTTGLEGAERPVVVKIIRREHAADPSFIARFLDEARVQSQLQHSGVAQVIEAASDEKTGEPYAVVEHVEGRSLGDMRARALQIGHRLSWPEAVSIGTMIADALAHVHERKDPAGRPLAIVHRDLSPQNVMVSFQGEVKIIDFGTARGQNRRCRTVSGVVFAKPGYVAPEVANGDTGDARVDLYALGIMLWELCAGRRFLQGDAGVHMANVARNQCSPAPIAEAIGAPLELNAIIAKLTAFERLERYSDARLAARDLAKVLASAGALPNGERGIRARTAQLMQTLFPSEPERTRREFAKLLAASASFRKKTAGQPHPQPKEAAQKPADAPAKTHTADHLKEHSDPNLLPGTRYKLIREIGRGASSVVHEAEHVDLMRRVALKVLTAEHTRVPEFAARFRREARALSRLVHDHLVKILDFGVASDGRLFCAMELLEGETLEARIEREKSLSWQASFDIGRKALQALEVAHAAGVVHRDIKPANIFLTKDGGLKLLDFGLAKAVAEPKGAGVQGEKDPDANAKPASKDAGDAAADEFTKKPGFAILGTPEYMAPEQASSGQVDARSDIYAVGVVLYEMITASMPFSGPSPVAILASKIKGMPEKPSERCPLLGLPQRVDEVLMQALARHPSLRFQSAHEMREAMEKALLAPVISRTRRRVAGLAAIAMTMAFAAVLLVGRAQEIRTAAAKVFGGRTQTERSEEVQAVPVDESIPAQEEPAKQAASEPSPEPSAQPVAEQPSAAEQPVEQLVPEPDEKMAEQKPAAQAQTAAPAEVPKEPQKTAKSAAPAPKARPRQHKKNPDKVKMASMNGAEIAHGQEPKSASKDEQKATGERTARKGSIFKPSRNELPPSQRKKKTRLAKKDR